MQITLGSATIAIKAPKSYALQTDIVTADGSGANRVRVLAAALGLCIPRGPSAPKVSIQRCKYDVLTYGGAVIDDFRERGISIGQILEAGNAALDLIREDWVGETEVKAAEDFTEGAGKSTG